MNRFLYLFSVFLIGALQGCAHKPVEPVSEADAAKLDRKLVREAVFFEPGAAEGAVVPDISAPRLRAVIVEEHIEGNRLIERHREWLMEGDIQLLGIPKYGGKRK